MDIRSEPPVDPDQASITLINVFGVSERDSERFLAHWRASARIMSEQPGFIRARMYGAMEGSAEFRYVNVAEWATIGHYERAHRNPRWRAVIRELVTDSDIQVSSTPALYRPVIDVDPFAPAATSTEEAARADPTYRFYRHRVHPEFRMVLRADDQPPPSTAIDEWEMTRERVRSDVNADLLDDIARRGYAVFRLRADLADIPASLQSGQENHG